MEKATVIALLEKYWQTETTIAEEQALAAYFQGDHVDADLMDYAGLFSYFQEEAQVSAGPEFGDRILQRLGLPPDEASGPGAAPGLDRAHAAPVVQIVREPFRFGIAAAAAAIVLILAGLFLLNPPNSPYPPEHPRMLASTSHAQVTDTYDDPEKALAAVRKALLVVSKNLNQGRREITGADK